MDATQLKDDIEADIKEGIKDDTKDDSKDDIKDDINDDTKDDMESVVRSVNKGLTSRQHVTERDDYLEIGDKERTSNLKNTLKSDKRTDKQASEVFGRV